jgi:hypothetical protein
VPFEGKRAPTDFYRARAGRPPAASRRGSAGRLDLRGIAALLIFVHFEKHTGHLFAQFLSQFHLLAAADFAVVERAALNRAAEHFLQTHGLAAELQAVDVVVLGPAPLVLHGERLPKPLSAPKRNAARVGGELHDVAAAGYAEARGLDAQSPNRQNIAAFFGKALVVRPLVQQLPLDRPHVFRPLLFKADERPLPPAEREMLQIRKRKKIVLRINHSFTVTVTPAGIAALSIVTS